MKKTITLLSILLLAFISNAYSNEFMGIYTTKPEIMPGFQKPYSAPVIKAIDRLTWKMEITNKNISIWLKTDQEPLVYSYKQEGKYLLGTNLETDTKMYIPFFIDKNGNIHGNSTVFYKTKT